MATRGIDTHAHLFLGEFSADIQAVTHRAKSVCEAVLLPNLDIHTLPALESLTESEPGFYYGMIGLHPSYVKADFREQLRALEKHLHRRAWIGIGEVGIDLYHDRSTFSWQAEALSTQAEWAARLRLPLSIHFRHALSETLEVLAPYAVRGVFHCFTGSYEEGKRILDAGFYIGIGGVVTYKNATLLRDAVVRLPLEAIVLETDSPYLAPVPVRSKRNESSYLTYIARAIGELRGISVEQVLEITTEAARRLFQLPIFSAA
ncbi:MAG: TatD family hydrolase [Bacteroidia bacterium]|nr:TatD family hydrolase [Bacteroidia bacterium]